MFKIHECTSANRKKNFLIPPANLSLLVCSRKKPCLTRWRSRFEKKMLIKVGCWGVKIVLAPWNSTSYPSVDIVNTVRYYVLAIFSFPWIISWIKTISAIKESLFAWSVSVKFQHLRLRAVSLFAQGSLVSREKTNNRADERKIASGVQMGLACGAAI